MHNPLPAPVREALRQAVSLDGYAGPRIHFDMSKAAPAQEVRPSQTLVKAAVEEELLTKSVQASVGGEIRGRTHSAFCQEVCFVD